MKSKLSNEKSNYQDAGFTLVELAAAFVILLILISIGVAGIMAYQDYACFNRQNSYAKTLFSVAQTKVTGLSVRGQMQTLKNAAVHEVDLTQVITPDGLTASSDKTEETVKNGKIYYLIGNREMYQHYLSGEYKGKTDIESIEAQTLYDLFDEFIVEKEILNASIALEVNMEQGLVYSVFYSDKCESFTYTLKEENGLVNILDRQTDYRSRNMIGYYGLW